MANPAEGWTFQNLDELTQQLMLEEFETNVGTGSVYESARFTTKGRTDHHDLFRAAIEHGGPENFADELNREGRLEQTELRKEKTVNVPVTAGATFAAGEFNRYYIRAVALRAGPDGFVRVYRARASSRARLESEQLIGTVLGAQDVLDEARRDPSEGGSLFGIPSGPNSGLSIELITD